MKIELDYNKSLEENASLYFEKSKKARVKSGRIALAIKETEKKLGKAKQSQEQKETAVFKKRTRSWFEKFHWFYSSDGFLVIGGRDAQSNETVVKKHMEEKDLHFHADIQGAPHCVLKTEGKKPSGQAKKEAAAFAAVYSKAWPSGLATVDVYSVTPENVSKKAPSGESMGTGAFMIYGEREWFKKQPMELFLGIDSENRVIAGPESAVKKHSKAIVKIIQGKQKKGETAKQAKALLEKKLGKLEIHLDEFNAAIPAGGTELKVNT